MTPITIRPLGAALCMAGLLAGACTPEAGSDPEAGPQTGPQEVSQAAVSADTPDADTAAMPPAQTPSAPTNVPRGLAHAYAFIGDAAPEVPGVVTACTAPDTLDAQQTSVPHVIAARRVPGGDGEEDHLQLVTAQWSDTGTSVFSYGLKPSAGAVTRTETGLRLFSNARHARARVTMLDETGAPGFSGPGTQTFPISVEPCTDSEAALTALNAAFDFAAPRDLETGPAEAIVAKAWAEARLDVHGQALRDACYAYDPRFDAPPATPNVISMGLSQPVDGGTPQMDLAVVRPSFGDTSYEIDYVSDVATDVAASIETGPDGGTITLRPDYVQGITKNVKTRDGAVVFTRLAGPEWRITFACNDPQAGLDAINALKAEAAAMSTAP